MIFLLAHFTIGLVMALLLLSPRSATVAGVGVIAASVALAAIIVVAFTSGLSDCTSGVALLIAASIAGLVVVAGFALGLGMIEAAAAGSNSPVWEILFGALLVGSHLALGRRLLRRPYGLFHLVWDTVGIGLPAHGAWRMAHPRPTQGPANAAARRRLSGRLKLPPDHL